jgi:hypothetical protein
MLAAVSAILISIAAGITMFVQTITLSGCRQIDCCGTGCRMNVPWYDRPVLDDPESHSGAVVVRCQICYGWWTGGIVVGVLVGRDVTDAMDTSAFDFGAS